MRARPAHRGAEAHAVRQVERLRQACTRDRETWIVPALARSIKAILHRPAGAWNHILIYRITVCKIIIYFYGTVYNNCFFRPVSISQGGQQLYIRPGFSLFPTSLDT